MTNTTETYWDVNGQSLQTLAYNINTLGGDRKAVPPIRGSNVLIPHRPGKKWVPKEADEQTRTLAMWVVGQNEDGTVDAASKLIFDRNLRKLQRLLWDPYNMLTITKRFWVLASELTDAGISLVGMTLDDSEDYVLLEVTAQAEYTGGLTPDMHGQTMGRFTVDLRFPDPFFYGDELEVSFDAVAPALTAQAYSQPSNPSPQDGTVLDDGWEINDPNSAFEGSTIAVEALMGVDPTENGEVITLGTQVGSDNDVLMVGVGYGRASDATDLPVTAGTRYTFGLYSKAPFNNVLGLRIQFYKADNSLIATVETGYAPVEGNVFKRLIAPGILVPALADHARVSYRVSPTGIPWRGKVTNLVRNFLGVDSVNRIPSGPFFFSSVTTGSFLDIPILTADTLIDQARPVAGGHIYRSYVKPSASATMRVYDVPDDPAAGGHLNGSGIDPQTVYTASCYIAASKNPSSGYRIGINWYTDAGVSPISTSYSPYASLSNLSSIAKVVTAHNPVPAVQPFGTVTDWRDMAFGNNVFVAVSDAGTRVATSEDGETWVDRGNLGDFEAIIFLPEWGYFVAVGHGYARTSVDGITWTANVALSTFGGSPSTDSIALAWSGTLLMAISQSGGTKTSPDGITWTNRTAPANTALGAGNQFLAFGAGLFTIVNNAGANRVYTSPDGITWTARTAAQANPWHAVAFGNGIFVAVCDSGTNKVMTSTNGTAWTVRTMGSATNLWSINFVNGVFYSENFAYYSQDGITWSPYTVTNGYVGVFTKMVWGNDVIVAAALLETAGTSDAGKFHVTPAPWVINWQRLSVTGTSPDNALYAVAFIEAADATIFGVGDTLAVSAFMVTKSNKLYSWFSGLTPLTDGLTHSFDASTSYSHRSGDILIADRVSVTEGLVAEDYYDGATVYADPDKNYDWEAGAYTSRSVKELPDPDDPGTPHTITVIGDARTDAIIEEFEGPLWAPKFINTTPEPEVMNQYTGKILTGDSATIDVQDYSATKTVSAVTSEADGLIRHSGSPSLLYLFPGDNDVKLLVDAGDGSAILKYRPKWF